MKMQEGMYDFFNKIMRDSKAAYQYAEEHFDELMARPIAKVLYGPRRMGQVQRFRADTLYRMRLET